MGRRLTDRFTRRVAGKLSIRHAIIHPVVLAVCPALSLYSSNAGYFAFSEAAVTLFGIACSSALLWILINIRVRNARKSGLVVTMLVLLVFYFPYLRLALLPVLRVVPDVALRSRILFLILCLAVGICIWYALRSSRDLLIPTSFLNVVAFTLLVLAAAIWYGGHSRADKARALISSWYSGLQPDSVSAPAGSQTLPDIYYIIVDGYARSDVLQQVYQYDDSEFLSYLDGQGFYVADRSNTNYFQTALSVASSLNFMYLDELAAELGPECENRLPLAALIQDSRVQRRLRGLGYTTVAFATGHTPTEIRTADRYLAPPSDVNMFQATLINNTIFPVLSQLPFLPNLFDSHRNRIAYTFDHLADATSIDGPTFVFAHIVAPHPPFVFGANGEHLAPAWELYQGEFSLADGPYLLTLLDRSEYIDQYSDQLGLVSTELQTTVDTILQQSEDPPVIIIQADHGPGSAWAWEDVSDEGLFERMGILNAYYFPDGDYGSLYEDISPVNTFRVVFNKYLGTDYPPLPDESFFSSWEKPYSFAEVPVRR